MTPTPATHVALLRAVNLGPHNKVAMRDLAELVTGLGLEGARTLLQSGNVVFRVRRATPAALETRLEEALSRRFGLATDVFVRTSADWRTIVAENPFPEAARQDPSHLVVMCLKSAPAGAAVTALQAAITGREVVRVAGRTAYFVYPDGIGPSKLTASVIERKLGTRGTARNWNTVMKLAALLGVA